MIAESSVKDGCAICEVVFTELYSKLGDNDTVERVEDLLDHLCRYVPSAYVNTVCLCMCLKYLCHFELLHLIRLAFGLKIITF